MRAAAAAGLLKAGSGHADGLMPAMMSPGPRLRRAASAGRPQPCLGSGTEAELGLLAMTGTVIAATRLIS